MMNAASGCGALVVLLVLTSACGGSVTATGPTKPITPPLVSDFPAVSQPARIYLFASGPYPVHAWTNGSRYVLYDDGTFALQYLHSQGSPEYRGTYTEANALITFRWQANQNVPAPWRPATGTLIDDALTVRYDLIMNLDDFEDAVYIRTQ